MKEFSFFNSSWRNAPLAFIGIVFSFVILLARDPNASWKASDYGGLFCFASIAALFGGRLLDTRPRVVINEHGIQDLRSNMGIINWPEISKVVIGSVGSIQQIIVHVQERDRWLNKSSAFTRFMWRLNGREKFVIKVNLQNMYPDARSVEEFIKLMISLHGANSPANTRAPKGGARVG